MLKRIFERRAIQSAPWQQWAQGDDLFTSGSSAGVRVTENTALSLLSVYSCVRLIADTISTFDLEAYRDSGDTRVELSLPRWLEQPNPETLRIDMLNQVVVSLLMRGNAYLMIVRDQTGSVRELWNLHPDEVRVTRTAPGAPIQYTIRNTPIPTDAILHIRGLSLPGSPVGMDPITYAAQGLGLGIAAQDYGATFFSQSAIPAAVIEAPGLVAQEQVEMLRDQFMRWHSGRKNAHLPAILAGGASYKPVVGILPEQAQFLETRKFTDGQIRRLFGIDPFASDESSFTYSNVEQRGLDVLRFTLRPWLIRIEQALSTLLARPRYVTFDTDSMQRADLKTRYDAYKVAIESGFLQINEVRDLEKLLPLANQPAADPSPETPPPDPLAASLSGRMDSLESAIRAHREVRVQRDASGLICGIEEL